MISIIYKDVNGNSASGAQDVAATRFAASRQKQAAAVVVADWRGTFISPAPQYTWLRIAKAALMLLVTFLAWPSATDCPSRDTRRQAPQKRKKARGPGSSGDTRTSR